MIELLVRHFERHGFQVGVLEGILLIRKRIGERVVGYSWSISPLEIQFSISSTVFLEQADRIIAQLNKAIAEESEASYSA